MIWTKGLGLKIILALVVICSGLSTSSSYGYSQSDCNDAILNHAGLISFGQSWARKKIADGDITYQEKVKITKFIKYHGMNQISAARRMTVDHCVLFLRGAARRNLQARIDFLRLGGSIGNY